MLVSGARQILLVEDEAIIALGERLILERAGYEVLVTGSGEQAVELVRKHPDLDLVLMDIDLGAGIDGTECAQRVLAEREIPIVFLTGHGEHAMVDRVRGITRYGYVMKNSGDFVLLQAVSMALELFDARFEMKAEIETRRRTEEELLARNRFIETILDNLPIGLAVNFVDGGTATYMNRRFEEIYGWPKSAITDIQGFFERVYPDPAYRDRLTRRIMDDIRSGDPERMKWNDILITRSDGSTRVVSAKNIPLPEQNFMISTVQDLTDLQRSRAELRSVVQKLELAIDTAELGIWTLPPGCELLEWNDQMYENYGVSRDGFVPLVENWLALVHPDDLQSVRSAFAKTSQGEPVQNVSFRVVRPNGEVRYIAASATPMYDEGAIAGSVGINIDQTEIARDRNALQELIGRQDLLMRETNHRIKNNLATVVGLLGFAEASTGADLSNVRHQLDAIRSVHELILEPERIAAFNVRPYLEQIVNTAVASGIDAGFIVRVDIDDVSIHSRVAVPLGLLVNELVTNAVRHGITTEERERIAVTLAERGSRCLLVVENTGVPFPADVDVAHPESLGLRLVGALVRQLDATLSVEREPTTRFIVNFPLEGSDLPE